jgi:uncharacterized protein (UPF0212 family)
VVEVIDVVVDDTVVVVLETLVEVTVTDVVVDVTEVVVDDILVVVFKGGKRRREWDFTKVQVKLRHCPNTSATVEIALVLGRL